MNKKGFTLIELLTVVLIIGVLTSIALPQYMRSIERSRATEAMVGIKALNDAVYAYAAERSGNECPHTFKKLSILLPGEVNENGTEIKTKDFVYKLHSASNAPIPGTDCPGVTATRTAGKYNYVIWNPYIKGKNGEKSSLRCYADSITNKKGKEVCESLDLYDGTKPN